jgi:hypothetical protein
LNNLTIEHSDPSMVDRFENAYNRGMTCEEFLPVPKNEDGRIFDGWYDWCVNNWGTKWDFGADIGTDKQPEQYALKATRVGNQISCTFDSAWAPPVGLYNKLVELGYDVKASYFEPGMAFCGIYDNGADNYIEYKSKDMIPVAIWNEFDLTNFFAEDEEVEA